MFSLTNEAMITTGGRVYARRLLAVLAAIVTAASLRAGSEADTQINVRENNGLYTVTAAFQVLQPASVAFRVLTDYEQIPTFMPDVRTSVVLERSDNWAVIEQEATAKFLMFSKRVHLVLEVQEQLGTIRFRDTCGKSFTTYEGSWTLTQKNRHTLVNYELVAKPSFDVPEFLLKRLLKRDASEMIEKLQGEIAARARQPRH